MCWCLQIFSIFCKNTFSFISMKCDKLESKRSAVLYALIKVPTCDAAAMTSLWKMEKVTLCVIGKGFWMHCFPIRTKISSLIFVIGFVVIVFIDKIYNSQYCTRIVNFHPSKNSNRTSSFISYKLFGFKLCASEVVLLSTNAHNNGSIDHQFIIGSQQLQENQIHYTAYE